MWEGYKPRLREHASRILTADLWSEVSIGSGAILRRTVDAIEIQDRRFNLTNNLVFWQTVLAMPTATTGCCWRLSRTPACAANWSVFCSAYTAARRTRATRSTGLSELTGAKYPLLAYLYFLKDMDRFMPIQPTTFDRAFRHLGMISLPYEIAGGRTTSDSMLPLAKFERRWHPWNGLSQVRLLMPFLLLHA